MYIVPLALLILLLGVLVFVLFTFAFAWYEQANANPGLIEKRFSAGSLWLAARLICRETAVLLFTVVTHPLGWIPVNEKTLHAGSRPPVILLHGLFQNRACWILTKRRLKAAGFETVYTLNLPPWKNVEALTERLAKKVDELRLTAGIDRVLLAGHSMGGIIARNYIQIRGGAGKIGRFVMLAVPNGGSKLAPFAISPLGKLVLPGAEFLQRLNDAEWPSDLPVTAIYTRHENIVLPFENARFEAASQVELSGMGHTSLLVHPRAFEALLSGLNGEQT